MNDARSFFLLGLTLLGISAILTVSELRGLRSLRDRLMLARLMHPERRARLLAEEGIPELPAIHEEG